MQIQKGLVKYKDRSDIVCTYGLTDEGKQYYFLDNTSMSNGNIIASTVLVEAIDPVVVASSVGVIDPNGMVVIPFENKSIKPIMEGLLLVEVANSATPSVVEANSLRSDPLSATKLVTTPATIKDKINAKMGSEGRFVFNDQFSEATICDYEGSNILDNQYFSFIAIKNNEILYLCKNTVDSPVLEYSLTSRAFVTQTEDVSLDVQNTEVTQETIDGAMNAEEKVVGFNATDITEKDFESVMDGAPIDEPLPVEPSVVEPDEIPSTSVEGDVSSSGEIESEESVEMISDSEEPESVIPESIQQEESEEVIEVDENIVNDEVVSEEIVEEIPSVVEDIPVEVNSEVQDEVVSENVIAEEDVVETHHDEEVDVFAETLAADIEKNVSENSNEVIDNTDEQLMSFDFKDGINYLESTEASEDDEFEAPFENAVSEFKNDLFDVDLNSDIFADSTLRADKIDISESYSDFGYKLPGTRDSIIEDVASTMSNLIRQNKSQKQTILSYEEKMEQVASAYKKVVDKARNQLRDVEVLKNKVKNYETIITKLEAKLEVLENKVRDQDKVILNQTRELESLRPQVEGKEELVRILADAQNLLDQTI